MVRLDRCPRRRKSNSREDHSCLSMSLRICSSRLTPALRARVQTPAHVAPRGTRPADDAALFHSASPKKRSGDSHEDSAFAKLKLCKSLVFGGGKILW